MLNAPNSIEGGFSILLEGGVVNSTGQFVPEDASILQTGLVPAGTQSMRFKAGNGFGPLAVSLGGQGIPIFAVQTGPDYNVYAGDASAFGGQIVELQFSAIRTRKLLEHRFD